MFAVCQCFPDTGAAVAPHSESVLNFFNLFFFSFPPPISPILLSFLPHPIFPILSLLVYYQPWSSRAVRRCTTLSQKTRESWASARAISSLWLIRSTRTGTRECWTANQDSSLSIMSRSSFRCHTNTNESKRVEEEKRASRISQEGGKWRQGMISEY